MRTFTLIFLLFVTGLFFVGCRRATSSNQAGNSRALANANRVDGQPLDLNTATKAQLISLPGIGEAYAQRIIDHRPYREKTDLINRNIIPEATYREIQNKVIAKRN